MKLFIGSKIFPMVCRYCHQRVFYYTNDYGSKVFFDKLWPTWDKHNCIEYQNSLLTHFINKKKEKDFYILKNKIVEPALTNEYIVEHLKNLNLNEIFFQNNTNVLLSPEKITKKFIKKVKFNFETRKIKPYTREIYETGYIREIFNEIDLFKKFKEKKTEFNYLSNNLLTKKLTQLTIVVGNILDENTYSYTGYIEYNKANNIQKNDLVDFIAIGTKIFFDKYIWYFKNISKI